LSIITLKNNPNASGVGKGKKGAEKQRKGRQGKGLEWFFLIVDKFLVLPVFRHKKTVIFDGFRAYERI